VTEKKALATLYVDGEGRPSLEACMDATYAHCRKYGVNVVVMYTATGEGPCMALDRYANNPEFSQVRLVAVTPPAQRRYIADPRNREAEPVRSGIVGERRVRLTEADIPIISARLPFRSAADPELGVTDPMQLVDRAFGVLGGGFSLCIQAAMIACDAGAVAPGEFVAAMSADTALVIVATHTEAFLSSTHGLLVQHVICRPSLYDISKLNHVVTKRAIEAKKRETTAIAESNDKQLTDAPPQGPTKGSSS